MKKMNNIKTIIQRLLRRSL